MSKPFSEPAYTQISNAALDEVLPVVSPAVWKILCAILRKTKGFHKVEDELSYSQFEEMTGMAREAVARAIGEALKAGYILRKKYGTSYKYRINAEYEITTSSEIEPVRKSNRNSSEIEPEPVRKSNTQKKERNTVKKGAEIHAPVLPEKYAAAPAFVTAWVDFLKNRKQLRKPLTEISITRLFAKFEKFPMPEVIAALNKSTDNSWQGVFLGDEKSRANGHHAEVSAASYREEY